MATKTLATTQVAILAWLREHGIPAVEVGMGIQDEDGQLAGLVAVVNHFPGNLNPLTSPNSIKVNEYDRNIQVADLNALNALLAVIEWKRFLGYYASHAEANEVVYSLFAGTTRIGRGLSARNRVGEEDSA